MPILVFFSSFVPTWGYGQGHQKRKWTL